MNKPSKAISSGMNRVQASNLYKQWVQYAEHCEAENEKLTQTCADLMNTELALRDLLKKIESISDGYAYAQDGGDLHDMLMDINVIGKES